MMRVLCVIIILAMRAIHQAESFSDLLSHLNRCKWRQLDECLTDDLKNSIDMALSTNDTYRLNQYLTVTINGHPEKNRFTETDSLFTRILTFIGTLNFNYAPKESMNDSSDESPDGINESRKKKSKGGKKDKMSMMVAMGAMGMSAIGGMFNTAMTGGVSMIAMKALIIAKTALILAIIIAIKKLLGGGGGTIGIPQQPVMWNNGGGGSDGGYRRSFNPTNNQNLIASSLAYNDQIKNISSIL
ncbi:uncharacterized protein LOC126901445 [Daktulosphaira vitifoliae]|uniref:uncharacterized protein LOC126901445 n=1 Tax=Daktulosphaira vitifoliae TaxID=58002 RepID=UPI0021A991F5|nr:uncharacterized protein LOC126901445 [Daktulosphaira vitifoliae]